MKRPKDHKEAMKAVKFAKALLEANSKLFTGEDLNAEDQKFLDKVLKNAKLKKKKK